jgi:hypothetical protein
VRSIERVLGEKVERRTLKDFDYKKSAAGSDTEFARPPFKPQRGQVRASGGPRGIRQASRTSAGGHQPFRPADASSATQHRAAGRRQS